MAFIFKWSDRHGENGNQHRDVEGEHLEAEIEEIFHEEGDAEVKQAADDHAGLAQGWVEQQQRSAQFEDESRILN